MEVLKIHAASVVKEGEIDFESVVKMSDGLNGADLRNVVTEAGLFAIKDYRDAVNQDDFNKAVRKVAESKKLEGKLGKLISLVVRVDYAYFANSFFRRVREALNTTKQFCIGWAHYTRSAAIDVQKCKCIIQASISLIHEEALSNFNQLVAVSISA